MIQTIGKILVILLVIALIAGGIFGLVQDSSQNSAASAEQSFSRQNTNGSRARPEGFGGHDRQNSASLGRRMGGLLVTLLQIGAITFIVLQVQKVLARPSKRKLPDPV